MGNSTWRKEYGYPISHWNKIKVHLHMDLFLFFFVNFLPIIQRSEIGSKDFCAINFEREQMQQEVD